jgi:VanZ family protein
VLLAVRTTNLVLAVYWVALFVGTHVPVPPDIVQLAGSDKTLHFLAYLGLSLLIAVCVRPQAWSYLWLLLGLSVYGALDELLQIPVNRSAEAADWLADVAGAAAGLGAFALGRVVCAALRQRSRDRAETLEASRVPDSLARTVVVER